MLLSIINAQDQDFSSHPFSNLAFLRFIYLVFKHLSLELDLVKLTFTCYRKGVFLPWLWPGKAKEREEGGQCKSEWIVVSNYSVVSNSPSKLSYLLWCGKGIMEKISSLSSFQILNILPDLNDAASQCV